MYYKISICYPDKKEIEEKLQTFSEKKALAFFDSFPWQDQLTLMGNMDEEKIHFNPSVRFTNPANNMGLDVTAIPDEGKVSFALWYERPVLVKTLFGLGREKEKWKLTDKWGFDPDAARTGLEAFLNEDYAEMERVMER
ncbi:MAG: hypothetical protein AB8F95_00300 [Bacteroidia bacterium]